MNNLSDNILKDLINFSDYNRELDSNYFQDKYSPHTGNEEEDKKNRISKREITLVIVELVETCDEFMICSNERGYYIPKTEEGARHGLNFIASRENKLRERREKLQKQFDKLFTPAAPDLFNQAG